MEHPYASDKELAELLVKSYRTVQNQFASIYGKMVGFFDSNERITDKRRLLIDIMKSEFD